MKVFVKSFMVFYGGGGGGYLEHELKQLLQRYP